MKKNVRKVEVEGGELALKNSHGDMVIIPKKHRLEVEGMIKDKCWGCIDAFVDTLPVAADYAQDGSVYPTDTKGNPIQDVPFSQWVETIKEMNPNFDPDKDDTYNYRGAYEGGLNPVRVEDGTFHLPDRNPNTGEILKSEKHPTFNQTMAQEMRLGYEPYRGADGKIYSKRSDDLDKDSSDVVEYLGTYGGTYLPEVEITEEAPQWVKYGHEFEKKFPVNVDYEVDKRFKNFTREQTVDRIRNPHKLRNDLIGDVLNEREEAKKDYIGEAILRERPRGDMSRGEYLNQLNPEEEELVKRFPEMQTNLWQDTVRGLQAANENNIAHTIANIQASPFYSDREKAEMIREHVDKGILKRAEDTLGALSFLTVPSKMIQSTYKDGYTFEQALRGEKNNAGLLEDVATDPLNLVGAGIWSKMSKTGRLTRPVGKLGRIKNMEGKTVTTAEKVMGNTGPYKKFESYISKEDHEFLKRINEIPDNKLTKEELIREKGILGKINERYKAARIEVYKKHTNKKEREALGRLYKKSYDELTPEELDMITKVSDRLEPHYQEMQKSFSEIPSRKARLQQLEESKKPWAREVPKGRYVDKEMVDNAAKAYFKEAFDERNLKKVEALDKKYGTNLRFHYDFKRHSDPKKAIGIMHPEDWLEHVRKHGKGLQGVAFRSDPVTGRLGMAFVGPNISEERLYRTVSHELAHRMNEGGALLNKELKSAIEALFPDNIIDIVKEGTPTSILLQADKELRYIKTPTEFFSFMSTNLKKELADLKLINSVHDDIPSGKILDDSDTWFRFSAYLKDENKALEMINEIPYSVALAIGAPGILLMNEKEEEKDGM